MDYIFRTAFYILYISSSTYRSLLPVCLNLPSVLIALDAIDVSREHLFETTFRPFRLTSHKRYDPFVAKHDDHIYL